MAKLIVEEKRKEEESYEPKDGLYGLVTFIKRLFEGKDIFLSTRDYISLLLGIWALILIKAYSHKSFIDDWWDYSPAYFLIGVFLLELIRKAPQSRRIFMRIFKRADYNFERYKDEKTTIRENKQFIEKYAKSRPNDVINIIENLITNGRFNGSFQFTLFKQYNDLQPILINYIENLIQSHDSVITTRALNEYLSLASINKESLQRLVEIYGKRHSFLFNIGRLKYSYEFKPNSIENKYYIAGYSFGTYTPTIDSLITVIGGLLLVVLFVSTVLSLKSSVYYAVVFFIFLLMSVASLEIIRIWHWKNKIKDSLLKVNLPELSEIDLEEFVKDTLIN